MIKQNYFNNIDLARANPKYSIQISNGIGLTHDTVIYELEETLKEFGIVEKNVIPSDFFDLQSFYSRYSFVWSYTEQLINNYAIGGSIGFTSTNDFVAKSILHNGDRLYLFDDFDNMWKVYIQLDTNEVKPILWYENKYERKITKLSVSIEQYIQKCLFVMGLNSWHQFFLPNGLEEQDDPL